MIYLASPYSHPHPLMREWRYRRVCEVAAGMMETEIVFCPIAHSHPIATHGGAPGTDWKFWARQDLAILERCDALVVARMPGWRESLGVTAEIDHAVARGVPVYYGPNVTLDLEV